MTQLVIGDTVITTKEQAAEKISELKAEFYDITEQIASLSDEFDIWVQLDIDGSYGTGASRYDGEWQASSQSC